VKGKRLNLFELIRKLQTIIARGVDGNTKVTILDEELAELIPIEKVEYNTEEDVVIIPYE
jgi:hypothetical protein